MKVPIGFRFAGAHAGLKPVRRDVALVVSDVPAAAAGIFTINRAAAAPIVDARPRVPSPAIRAVLVNSGNANALTGAQGLADVAQIRATVASALGAAADQVLTASTGVIDSRLPFASTRMFASSGCSRSVASGISAIFFLKTTSTSVQRGVS